MEVSYREIIRETKNAVTARFDMLESLLSLQTKPAQKEPVDNKIIETLVSRINNQNEEINHLKSLLCKFNDLMGNIQKKIESMEHQKAPIVNFMSGSYEQMPELNIDYTDKPQNDNRVVCTTKFEEEDEIAEEEEEVGEEEEEEVAEEEEEEVGEKEEEVAEEEEEVAEKEEEEEAEEEEEVAEEEEEEEVEEEESSLELEEFEYRGMTLYRDSENLVYRMDEEGALSDPLGIWDDAKQKIKKIV